MNLKPLKFFLLPAFMALSSCALQIAPQGGEKDTTPPVLLGVIPPNGATRFSSKEVVFEFDEYLQLKDAASKLVVSPPLKNTPVVKARKNLLVLTVEDTLRPDVTYTFNFGDAVTDLNEGNPYPGLSYVVSTGAFVDTLQVSGIVRRAEDLKPEKGMLVLLYASASSDSAPYLERPLYFAKTDDKGAFRILNIAAGDYRIFGLNESNANYLYDDPAERIAFLASTVHVPDSGLQLASFIKPGGLFLQKAAADGPGKVQLVFNRPDTTVAIRLMTDSVLLGMYRRTVSPGNDTVIFWYRNLSADTAAFELRYPDHTDTVQVRLNRKESVSTKKRGGFRLTVDLPETANGIQPDHRPLTLRLNHPLASVDTSLIRLTADGALLKTPAGVSSGLLDFSIPFTWHEGQSCDLLVIPGAVKDIFGLSNDTVQFRFRIGSSEDYGTLKVHLSGSAASGSQLLLLVGEDDRIIRQAAFRSDTVCLFEHLSPGSYRLKRVVDVNENKRWDAGNDLLRVYPETVEYYYDAVPVRANWDVEVKWNLLVPQKQR